MTRRVFLIVMVLLLGSVSFVARGAQADSPPPTSRLLRAADATPLFCAYGGAGVIPLRRSPDFERWFAVAVVELDSPRDLANVSVSDFVLLDHVGGQTRFKRVVQIEEFDRVRTPAEGAFAYYLNPGGTKAWNGSLPAGRIRLRVRVALTERPASPERFRLTIGSLVIEGRVDGEWPT